MSDRYIILHLARRECEKNLEKSKKKVKKQSDKLFGLDDCNNSIRKRAMLRVALDSECEERDRWQSRIAEIDRWLAEITSSGKIKREAL